MLVSLSVWCFWILMQEFSAQVGEPITIERQCGTSGSTLVAAMQIKETTDTGPLELSKQARLKGQSGFRPKPTEPVWFFVNSTPHFSTSSWLAGHGVVWNKHRVLIGRPLLIAAAQYLEAGTSCHFATTLSIGSSWACPLQDCNCKIALPVGSCSSGNEDHHRCTQWPNGRKRNMFVCWCISWSLPPSPPLDGANGRPHKMGNICMVHHLRIWL